MLFRVTLTGYLRFLRKWPPKYPSELNTPEARATMFHRVVKCCRSEGPCVEIIAPVGSSVSFCKPDELERFHHDNRALHLPYGGVAKSRRKQGAFCRLIEMVMSSQVPLTATVKHTNQCRTGARLMKIGFARITCNDREEQFRWQPCW